VNIPYAVQQDPKGVIRWQRLELGKPNIVQFCWRARRNSCYPVVGRGQRTKSKCFSVMEKIE
jgi:hypothetical protein